MWNISDFEEFSRFGVVLRKVQNLIIGHEIVKKSNLK